MVQETYDVLIIGNIETMCRLFLNTCDTNLDMCRQLHLTDSHESLAVLAHKVRFLHMNLKV